MDHGLLRNGSGYVDITAYKAIKNAERNMNMANCKRGEIFEVRMINSDEIRKALVVSADFRTGRTWQSVLILMDEQKQEDWVPVVCRGMMYADCSKLSYIDSNRLYSYIRTATEDEMAAVDEAIAEQLGLKLENKAECVPKPVLLMNKDSVQVFKDNSEELAAVQKEAEIYKNLYNQLLEKLIGTK